MKYISNILYTFLLFSFLYACTAESDFKGIDNSLVKLSLTVGEKTYNGIISENRTVQFFIPEEVDLNEAKVEYKISENASILPNPMKIKDWNNEQVFNVISYNGKKQTYIVRIVKQGEKIENTIRLTTDDEVKAFAEKKVSEITGTLIIGNEMGTDSIKNIDALTYLTKVQYEIIVNPTYKGKNLNGLRNLKEVGSLIINNNNITELSLKNLEEIREDLIINSKTLQKLLLPRLKKIEKNTEINADRLTETNFESLTLLNSFTLKSQSIAVLSFQNLEYITGSVTLSSLPNLMRVNMKKVKRIEKDFTLKVSPAVQILNMNKLEEVNGNFEISGTALPMLILPELKYIKGWCGIENNSMMKVINARNLTKVDGSYLKLTSLPVKSLVDFGLREAGGEIWITRLTSLNDLDKFIKKLQKAHSIVCDFLLHEGTLDLTHLDMSYEYKPGETRYGRVSLKSCSNISLLKLPKVKDVTIEGDKDFVQKKVTNIIGTGEVGDITYRLNIEPGQELTISGFEKIERVYNIPNCEKLSILDATEINDLRIGEDDLKIINLPKLKKMAILMISSRQNNSLTDLNAFAKVGGIKYIDIRNNKALVDYSGLKKSIQEGGIKPDEWGNLPFNIDGNGYNPTYEDLKAGRYVKP